LSIVKGLLAVCVFAGLLACGGGGPAESAAGTEQDLYEAIAASDVRYALLTRSEDVAEIQTAKGEIIKFGGIDDMDALAQVLSKERVEYDLQEQRVAQMPQ